MKKTLVGLVLALALLFPMASASAHGGWTASGSVSKTFGLVSGTGSVLYDSTHASMIVYFYLEAKGAGQTSFHQIGFVSKTCSNCRQLTALVAPNVYCANNTTYRMRMVFAATSHSQATAARGARTLC